MEASGSAGMRAAAPALPTHRAATNVPTDLAIIGIFIDSPSTEGKVPQDIKVPCPLYSGIDYFRLSRKVMAPTAVILGDGLQLNFAGVGNISKILGIPLEHY